jgi:cysteinyl-tRNA synthetase, unknown class
LPTVLLLSILLLLSACKQSTAPEEDRDFRRDMRDFVQQLSAYAKQRNPTFAVIIQNGHELLTDSGEGDGEPAETFIETIDGAARESLFYGYEADDRATPTRARDHMLSLTDLAHRRNLTVLVTDYCSTRSSMDDSYARNADRDYVSFAADHRGLDNIPAYPESPHAVNPDDIAELSQARNFLYLIDPGEFDDKETFIAALEETDYDLLIVDMFFDYQPLNAADISRLQRKENGGSRLVIAYMSIGEAEDYRYYFNPEWIVEPPTWMDAENPDWEGNYKVRYWDEEWQAVIFGKTDSYLQKVMDAGFDGVYLDIIDAFEYFERD